MAKAMLIMDMPESCEKCPMYNLGFCKHTGYFVHHTGSKNNDRQDWCLIREVPEKYETVSMDFERGYNACIDEILKDETGGPV